MVRNFRELKVWERAHQLTLSVYEATRGFPKEELVGLTSVMRRIAASIPAQIVEGCQGATDVELGRHVKSALGSISELEYQLILAHDLNYIPREGLERLTAEAGDLRKALLQFGTGIRAFR